MNQASNDFPYLNVPPQEQRKNYCINISDVCLKLIFVDDGLVFDVQDRV